MNAAIATAVAGGLSVICVALYAITFVRLANLKQTTQAAAAAASVSTAQKKKQVQMDFLDFLKLVDWGLGLLVPCMDTDW